MSINCESCGRQLKEDSRYCDFCGNRVPEKPDGEIEYKEVFDTNLFFKGVLLSIGITVIISIILSGSGIPIFFGGLFLPFFFRKKKVRK